MTGDDSDDIKTDPEVSASVLPTEGVKLTPPPKPRRDSSAALGGEAPRGPSIPSAPRVPLIPADNPPPGRRAESASERSEAPRPRAVSEAPRPRQRSETPRARTTPSVRASGTLRSDAPGERQRLPSFPLPPPAPVSLSSEAMQQPALRGSGRPSASTGLRSSDPALNANAPAWPAPGPTLEIAPPPQPSPMDQPATSLPLAHSSPSPSPRPSPLPPEPERPAPSVAILAMRIIAVGAPAAEPADIEQDIEIHVDLPGALAESEPVGANAADEEPPILERLTPEPVELSDADVAPDSGGARTGFGAAEHTPALEVTREEAISIPPLEIEADTPVPEAGPPSELDQAKPPPPPRRKSTKPPASSKSLPTAKKRQRRPWWEDVFGEEFVRATPRASTLHVKREVDFIESSLGIAPGGVVLDLGCGGGHHAVELASRGYGLVGYDLSLYQLSLAAEVAQARGQKINFMQGDMREMAFEEMFDGVFSWNTSFGYFEEEKNLSVLERVFQALKPGGMFLIDVINRDFAAVQSPSQNWYEGAGCVCMDDMSLDFITSRLRVKRSVILDDGRTRECTYSIRVYSLHELGKLLHDVGFRVTEATGHPSVPGVFFGEHSPRIIVVAQKP
jgi:SAM-dependent methyltransferase